MSDREAAMAAVLGAVQERWGSHSLTRGYAGARASGIVAARARAAPALPPWWPGAEGFVRPNVLELSGPPSCGKLGLALLWLAAASRGGLTAVVDLAGTFYPPAAASAGLDLARLVVVRPPDRRGAAEAVSLLLGSAGFDAVLWPLAWRERPAGLDAARLATLASRSRTCLLALVSDRRRIAGAEEGSRLFPSADARLRVAAWAWTWRDGELVGVRPKVRAERLRGAPAGQEWELRLERHPVGAADAGAGAAGTGALWDGTDEDQAGVLQIDMGQAGAGQIGAASVVGASGAGASGGAGRDGALGDGTGLARRPGGCPPTDHLCLAAALPLGGGGARAAGPAGAPDLGVRPDTAAASTARTA